MLVAVSGLRKAFGATQALRDTSFEIRSGEVHAILGENGSGKSTLVKVLSGVHRPDGGEVRVDGHLVKPFASPREASAAGIATVFQEILVARQQSALTNVWLGSDGVLSRTRSNDIRSTEARKTIEELIDRPDLARAAGRFALNDRQAICITRALVRKPRVLILDEATSALDVVTRDRLFLVIDRLRAQGAGVVFISHRLDEVLRIADRITVMRGGVTVATCRRGEMTARELVQRMTGLKDADDAIAPQSGADKRFRDQVVLRTHQLRLEQGKQSIDFQLRAGELVGLAGLEGHGQDLFLRVLAGEAPAAGTVERVGGDGALTPLRSPYHALKQKIGYLPRDRRDESIFESLSVLDNFSITTASEDRRYGIIRRRSTVRRLAAFVDGLHISLGDPGDRITTLSGGNQQKIVLSRWLASNPAVLLLNDPTRGVDIAAKLDIYESLEAAAERGVAVVMLSTDLLELVDLMDRVLVFREGNVHREFSKVELSQERLVASYFGEEHP